jgi:methylmalonyl-CoA mutase N-terminal domain/subunit
MQDEIARSAYEYQRQIEQGDKIIVGVNKFTVDTELPIPGFKIDDSIRILQSEKLKRLKEKRNKTQVLSCLESIKQSAIDGSNLMPHVLNAVENFCTLGEISDVLRNVFGEHR